MADKTGGILATTKDLITRTKGLDDIYDDLAKVPKSDGSVSFNSTVLGAINTEVDNALDTAIPASPTTGSVNKIVKDLGSRLPASGTLATVDDLSGGGITAEQLGMLGGAGDDVPFYENWRGLVHEDANLVAFSSLTNTEKLFMQTRYQNAPIWMFQAVTGSCVKFDTTTDSYHNYMYIGYDTSSNKARLQALHPIFFTPTSYYQKSTIIVFECIFSLGTIHSTYANPFIGFSAVPYPTDMTSNASISTQYMAFVRGSANGTMRGFCYNIYGTSKTFDISISTGSAVHFAKIVYTPGTDVKFYMNDTLVGTLTTYLPSSQYSTYQAIPFYPVISVYGGSPSYNSWIKVYGMRYYRQNGA